MGGRDRTPDATQMAEASGENRIAQNGGAAIHPRACAVPPPGQCPRHGGAAIWIDGAGARLSSSVVMVALLDRSQLTVRLGTTSVVSFSEVFATLGVLQCCRRRHPSVVPPKFLLRLARSGGCIARPTREATESYAD